MQKTPKERPKSGSRQRQAPVAINGKAVISLHLSLCEFFMGDLTISRKWKSMANIETIAITASLSERLLTPDLDERLRPMLISIPAIYNLPSREMVEGKAKDLHVVFKFASRRFVSRSVSLPDESKSITIDFQRIIFLNHGESTIESSRRELEQGPLIVKIRDRDPMDDSVNEIRFGCAIFHLSPLVKPTNTHLKLSSMVYADKEMRTIARDDIPDSPHINRESNEVHGHHASNDQGTKPLPYANYTDYCTEVKCVVRLNQPFPASCSTMDRLLVAVICHEHSVDISYSIRSFLERYNTSQKSETKGKSDRTTKSSSNRPGSRDKESKRSSSRSANIKNEENNRIPDQLLGIDIFDGQKRIIIVEGIAELGIRAFMQYITKDITGKSRCQSMLSVSETNEADPPTDITVIFNPNYVFSNSLYQSLFEREMDQEDSPLPGLHVDTVKKIRIRESLDTLWNIRTNTNTSPEAILPANLIRKSKGATSCTVEQAVQKLYHLAQCKLMSDAWNNKLFPTAEMLEQLDAQFGTEDTLSPRESNIFRYQSQKEVSQEEHSNLQCQDESNPNDFLNHFGKEIELQVILQRQTPSNHLSPSSHIVEGQDLRLKKRFEIAKRIALARGIDINNQTLMRWLRMKMVWCYVPEHKGYMLLAFEKNMDQVKKKLDIYMENAVMESANFSSLKNFRPTYLPQFNILYRIRGHTVPTLLERRQLICTTTTSDFVSDEAGYCIMVSEFEPVSKSEIQCWQDRRYLPQRKRIARNMIKINRDRVTTISAGVSIKRKKEEEERMRHALHVPSFQEKDNDDDEVYIYSTQRLCTHERQLNEIREEMKRDTSKHYSYSDQYQSLALSPISEAEMKQEMQFRNNVAKSSQSRPKWVSIGHKTSLESNRHPNWDVSMNTVNETEKVTERHSSLVSLKVSRSLELEGISETIRKDDIRWSKPDKQNLEGLSRANQTSAELRHVLPPRRKRDFNTIPSSLPLDHQILRTITDIIVSFHGERDDTVNEQELRKYFTSFGRVRDVVMGWRNSQRRALVRFDSHHDAAAAMRAKPEAGFRIKDQLLKLKWGKPNADPPCNK